MDTSDPGIEFDSDGVCGHCRGAYFHIQKSWFPDSAGESKAKSTFADIRKSGENSKYDSIIGISGGVDSAVVALRAVENGLRPLLIHVDGGWNTKESVQNIRSITEELGLDLKTIVIDWEEMKKVQIAFLKSGTLNQDIPQDHAFFVSLYKAAMDMSINVIISGINYATESVQPVSWGHNNMDGRNLLNIYKRFFPNDPLMAFPIASSEYFAKEFDRSTFEVFYPLNYGSYNPEIEIKGLIEKFNWLDYGSKHEESIFTKWFQSVYLYERYAIDIRRAHQSCLIISGLTTREKALKLLETQPINDQEKRHVTRIVAQKLGLQENELLNIMKISKKLNSFYD
jgi:N-acetyl sugar amidotransferase